MGMKNKKYCYLFGPVPSRRFGRSLGVDLTPFKTCSLDCVFCQLGKTTHKTVIRKEYVPIQAVIAEIEHWMQDAGIADYITLSGSGEPTLHSDFGRVLEFLKSKSIPSVLLTNSTMLDVPEVRDAASSADIIKVSLSAWDQCSFDRVNRPHHQLKFGRVVEGLKKLREQFGGKIWAEVFLMPGINSMPEDIEKISALLKTIKPDRVQLNTVVRPPAENFAAALPKNLMESFTDLFDPPAEIIAEFNSNSTQDVHANEEAIFSMLRRRPCTMDQIADVFGMHRNEISKYLGKLMRANEISVEHKKTEMYYKAIVK